MPRAMRTSKPRPTPMRRCGAHPDFKASQKTATEAAIMAARTPTWAAGKAWEPVKRGRTASRMTRVMTQ